MVPSKHARWWLRLVQADAAGYSGTKLQCSVNQQGKHSGRIVDHLPRKLAKREHVTKNAFPRLAAVSEFLSYEYRRDFRLHCVRAN